MKKLRTVLVEDEGAALRRLKKFAEEDKRIEVLGSVKSGISAVEILNDIKPNLVLLDIELKDMSAFEVLGQIDKGINFNIIFITAFNQHAIKAFEVGAIDYLLKPYSKERFKSAIDRAYFNTFDVDLNSIIKSLSKVFQDHHEFKIEITEGNRTHIFIVSDILWIEADGYYCRIHRMDNESMLIRKTLKDIEIDLPKEYFTRINRSSIINKNYIEKRIENISQHYIYLKGNVKLKKSKRY